MTVEALRAALDHPNVAAFLRVIRAGETHPDDDEAYSSTFGWRPGNGVTFSDFTDHPRRAIKSPWGWTSAAGAYQAMCAVPPLVKTDTWGDFVRWCAGHNHAPQFGQADQDLFAAWCIRRRGAMEDVIAGRLDSAVHKCAKEWASFPGSPYGQPTKTMAQLRAVYRRHGGALATDAAPAPEKPAAVDSGQPASPSATEWDMQNPAPAPQPKAPMAPFIATALSAVLNAAPELIDMFKGGSKSAARNSEAVKVAVGVAKQALGAVNEQDLVERLENDPAARETVRAAVKEHWFEIHKAAEKSVADAREFATLNSAAKDVRAVVGRFTFIEFLTLVFLVLCSIAIGLAAAFDKVTQATLDNIILLAGVASIVGIREFWFGSSFGSRQKDEKADRAAP